MSNELVLVANQAGLAETQTQQLLKSFGSFFELAKEIAKDAKNIIVENETQLEVMGVARKKRLELAHVRYDVENTRKQLKEQSLREGKAIDGIANVIKALIVPVEEHLQLQEDFIKIKEEKRKLEVADQRTNELQKYEVVAQEFDLVNMTDMAYQQLLQNSKEAYQSRQDLIKKAEAEQIAREKARLEEEKRLRVENERLQKEAQLRAREEEERLAIERAKLEEERIKREAVESELKAQKEEQQKKELEELQAIERAKKESEEREKQRLLAPDKSKLLELATTIDNLQLPAVKSREASNVIRATQEMIKKMSGYIRERANTL